MTTTAKAIDIPQRKLPKPAETIYGEINYNQRIIKRNELETVKNKLETAKNCRESEGYNLYHNINTISDKTISDYGKRMRINRDIYTKIVYRASWGDNTGAIVKLVESIDKPHLQFLEKIKSIGTNVYGADIIYGPIKGSIVSNNKRENSWYNILLKAVKITIRANEHFINFFEQAKAKKEAEIAKIKLEEEKTEKRRQKKIEEEEKIKAENAIAERMKQLENELVNESWDDED